MKKYFGKFNSETDIQNAINNGELTKPYVAMVRDMVFGKYELDYNSKSVVRDWANEPFTVIAKDDGWIGWNQTTGLSPAIEFSYSINGGEWTTLSTTGDATFEVSNGDEVKFKAYNERYFGNSFWSNIDYEAKGNIMSLIYGDDFAQYQYEFPYNTSYNFANFFYESGFVLQDVSDLYLPATGLTDYCYDNMFIDTNIEKSPVIGTQLGFGETTTLASGCCSNMFKNCSNLNEVHCNYVFSNITAEDYFDDWMDGVAATGTFYKSALMDGISAGPWETDSVDGIPTGWEIV